MFAMNLQNIILLKLLMNTLEKIFKIISISFNQNQTKKKNFLNH